MWQKIGIVGSIASILAFIAIFLPSGGHSQIQTTNGPNSPITNQSGGISNIGDCSGNTVTGGNIVIINCGSNGQNVSRYLETTAKKRIRPNNWSIQKQNDVKADFFGCGKESINTVLCSVEFTNDGTDRKTIQARKKYTMIKERGGDIYKADKIKVMGEKWKNYTALSKVSPGRSVTFYVSFLVKPDAKNFDEFDITLNSSIGKPEFIFYP